jgi:hypothetical protein
MRNSRATRTIAALLSLVCLTSMASHAQTRPSARSRQPLPIPQGIATAPRCSLTLEQSPTIRGFRLGMSVDEVRQRFTTGFENKRADKFGMMTVRLPQVGLRLSSAAVNPSDFEGVLELGFAFYDGRLLQVSYQYAPGAKWRDVSQFLDVLSPAFGIERQLWNVRDSDNASLDCEGFALKAGLYLTYTPDAAPRIDVIDTAAQKIANKRRAEGERQNEAERRRAFKP